MVNNRIIIRMVKIFVPLTLLLGLLLVFMMPQDTDAKKKTGPIVTKKVDLILLIFELKKTFFSCYKVHFN